MTELRWRWTAAGLALALAAASAGLPGGVAAAQQRQASNPPSQGAGPPGLQANRGGPINIESDSLELRDRDKTATFINNVRLTQGDTILECKTLVVYYEDESTKAKPGGKPASKPAVATPMGQGGDQKISKLVAKGGVVLTQKDQTATGDNGIYDMKSNTMVMTGNVTLTQGQNVVRGDKLFVDLNTNISRVESTRKAGESRVQGLFLPNSPDTKKPGAEADPSSRAPAASNGAVRTQNSERDRAPPRSLR